MSEEQAGDGVSIEALPQADDYYDDRDDCCYECGGEGFVSDCVEEWACVDPDYGCDYCTRRCSLCSSATPEPQSHPHSHGEG